MRQLAAIDRFSINYWRATRLASAAGEGAGFALGRAVEPIISQRVMRLGASLQLLPDGLLLVARREGSLLEVAGALLGHEPELLVGRPLVELLPGVSPALVQALLDNTHDPHPHVPLRVRARRSDGTEVPVDVRGAVVDDDTALLTLRPVSEEARAAERALVTVVAAAPLAVLTLGLDGAVQSFNPAAERLFGIPACDACQSEVFRFVPASDHATMRKAFEVLRQGGSVPPTEVTRLRADDSDIEVEEHLTVLRDIAQNPIGFGAFFRDLNEVSRLRRANEILAGTDRAGTDEPSLAMREVEAQIEVAAKDGSATVLLLGETGVGKSLMARRIHAKSPRRSQPFLEVNCASLEPHLAESELFGHERGAFTGALTMKRGLVEAADRGTLFLDEVGELSIGVQAKLLTFLDQKSFRRLGAVRTLSADVRIVAATNSRLEEAVQRGSFRADLYYRLRVLPIVVPPLRERPAELPALVAELLHGIAHRVVAVDADALQALASWSWPGNLRELRNVLERSLLMMRASEQDRVALAHLPPELRVTVPAPVGRPSQNLAQNLAQPSLSTAAWVGTPSMSGGHDRLQAAEEQAIRTALSDAQGNRSRAAVLLGISRSTLNRKLDDLGVPKKRGSPANGRTG